MALAGTLQVIDTWQTRYGHLLSPDSSLSLSFIVIARVLARGPQASLALCPLLHH